MGRDKNHAEIAALRVKFQFTRPAWGATLVTGDGRTAECFNSRAPRGARRRFDLLLTDPPYVSIHAPRVGRDHDGSGKRRADLVSIHAPRVGRDTLFSFFVSSRYIFNSRAPRGARLFKRRCASCHQLFNSRAPRGARHPTHVIPRSRVNFQFTRPAWGATGCRRGWCARPAFQFTRPAWGATGRLRLELHLPRVSIHAPRVGRDSNLTESIQSLIVSIHAPRVGRDRTDAPA